MQILLLLLTAFVSGKNVKSFFEDQQFHDALMFVDSIATLTAAGNEARRLAQEDGSGEDDDKDATASVSAVSKLWDSAKVASPMLILPGIYYLLSKVHGKHAYLATVWGWVNGRWTWPLLELVSIVLAVAVSVILPEKQLKDDDSDDSDDDDNEDMSAASQSGLLAKLKGYGALLGIPVIALLGHAISVKLRKPLPVGIEIVWFCSVILGFLIQFGVSIM